MWMPDGRLRLVLIALASARGLCTGAGAEGQTPAGIRGESLCLDVVESVEGARNDPAALVYGVLLDDNSRTLESEYAHRLAIADLRTAVAGGRLPAGRGHAPRPVVAVVCGSGLPDDDSVAFRAADHLIRRLGVSAIVPASTSQALAAQRAIAASGASVLLICDRCATELREVMRGIGDTSLVFQNYAPSVSFSAVIHRKLPDFEAYARELPGFDGSPRIRVALLRPDGDWTRSLAETTDETLVINGARASLQRGTNYLHAVYGDGSLATEVAARLAAFRPHLVMPVSLGDSPELLAVLNALEHRLEPSAPRPLYWGWVHRQVLTALIGSDDGRRARVFSFAPGAGPPTPEQRDRLSETVANFRREFPDVPAEPALQRLLRGYPLPYQIMYAAVAAGPAPRLTGVDLARGIVNTQKSGATEVFIGRRDLVAGLAAAASGPIRLNSLSNLYPLNWSRSASGAPVVDSARIFCYTRRATGELVPTPTGQVWDRRTDSISGTFVPCR